MAESIDNGEFWLPSQFLTDDGSDNASFMDTKKRSNDTKMVKDMPMFYSDFGYNGSAGPGGGLWLDSGSPVGSSETESDEEDFYLAGLTRQMADSTLEGDLFKRNAGALGSQNTKGRTLSGSPQSTLSPVAHGCFGYTHRSASPKQATWDLLYAAAGEVARMQQKGREEEGYGFKDVYDGSRGLMGSGHKHSPPILCTQDFNGTLDGNFCPEQALSYKKLQALQFQQLKQQQTIKQQQQQSALLRDQATGYGGLYIRNQRERSLHLSMGYNSTAGSNSLSDCGGRTLGFSASAWPPLSQAHHLQLPQQPLRQGRAGSGMHAVIIGNPAAKRESVGTGVFLPRRAGASAEPRKKTACSTVLLPARVVQALNLNLDDNCAVQQPRFDGSHNSFDCDDSAAAALWLRNSSKFVSHQEQIQKGSVLTRPQQQVMGNEVRLPQEWTY